MFTTVRCEPLKIHQCFWLTRVRVRRYDVCIRAKDRYTTALLMQCGARFRDAFLADNYGQIRAENEEDYSTIVESFPYRNAALEETPFPRVLPFSSMVPAIYKQVCPPHTE